MGNLGRRSAHFRKSVSRLLQLSCRFARCAGQRLQVGNEFLQPLGRPGDRALLLPQGAGNVGGVTSHGGHTGHVGAGFGHLKAGDSCSSLVFEDTTRPAHHGAGVVIPPLVLM